MIVETDNLICAASYADMEGISPQHVHVLIHQERLPIVRIDGKPFIDKTKVEPYKKLLRSEFKPRKPQPKVLTEKQKQILREINAEHLIA